MPSFSFNDTATTEIYTLSLHDALPIYKIKAFFTVEGGGVTSVTNGGIGSKRYRVTYTGPGGHSYGAFGLVNPAYALGEAISLFSRSLDRKSTRLNSSHANIWYAVFFF